MENRVPWVGHIRPAPASWDGEQDQPLHVCRDRDCITTAGRPPLTFAQGDFTGDGLVNFDDLLVLAKNYNKTVPANGAAPAPAAAMDVQTLAAAMGIGVPTTTPTKLPAPPAPAKKPTVSPKPAPTPTPVVRAVPPAPVAAKAPVASVLRDDDKAKPVFSTTRVEKAAPTSAKRKLAAKSR